MEGKSSPAQQALDTLLRRGPPSAPQFRRCVRMFYAAHGRMFPWRRTKDPYRIFVSEVMLQQTQTDRVVPKYKAFIEAFPSWRALARASSAEVMSMWKGLGYYRRAFNLHRAAKEVATQWRGRLPEDLQAIRSLPGVGSYTAGAVAAFAFGMATPIIETNIRSVYLYTFFPRRKDVPDSDIFPLIEQTLDRTDPRTWYYALMDLGSGLKKSAKGLNERSRHHVKQSAYHGSNRQVRALVLKALTEGSPRSERQLASELNVSVERIEVAASGLLKEGLLRASPRRLLSLA